MVVVRMLLAACLVAAGGAAAAQDTTPTPDPVRVRMLDVVPDYGKILKEQWSTTVRPESFENILGGNAATGAATENTTDDCVLRSRLRDRFSPAGMDLSLRASEEASSNLNGASSKRERRGNAPGVCNAAGSDNRHAQCVYQRW